MNSKNIWIEATSGINNLLDKIKARPLVRDTITTTMFSIIGKGIGFLIPFFIATWFGVTSGTDAFFFAYGLILFLSGIFAPVIESIIVPYIAEARAKNEDVGSFVGRILGISGIGLAGLAGLFLLIIKPFLSLITHFDPVSLNLVYILLVETTPLIALLVWTSVLAGSLNAYKKFALPALSPAFRAGINLAIIFSLKDALGVHAIAWGYVIGEIFRVIILLSAIHKFKLFSPHFSLNLDPKLKEFFKTASYQIVGMVALGLNPVVDKTMASWLGEGSLSVLYYADRLYMIPLTFLSSGFIATSLSHWSSGYYERRKNNVLLRHNIKKALKTIGLLSILATLSLILLSSLIVRLVYSYGEFPGEKIGLVQHVLLCYLLGIIPYMLSVIVVRGHLVLRNTPIIMFTALVLNVLNIVFNLILMNIIGVSGIALSTSLVSVVSFGVFFAFLQIHLRRAK